MCSCLVIVTNSRANGGGRGSATALMAAMSGRAEVARTGATVKQKNDRAQRFLQRLYGFTEYLQLGRDVEWIGGWAQE